MKQPTVHIIGAGLCGLTLAYLLKKKGIKSVLLEANNRIGGRIDTRYADKVGSIEMGATWCNDSHHKLLHLLQELNISYTKQYTSGVSFFETSNAYEPQRFSIPDNEAPSYRIDGGTYQLIAALENSLNSGSIQLNENVCQIKYDQSKIIIETSSGKQIEADYVVSTLPPNLLVSNVHFEPELPIDLTAIAQKTHTWMGESIKFGLVYEHPFWKEKGYSGTVFSHVNWVQEMYDHSTNDNTFYALKGFLNGGASTLTQEERRQKIEDQLQRILGDEVKNATHYFEKVWREEPFTFAPYASLIMAHQNNGHPIYITPLFDNRFFISGSETAREHPGYMEGAIQAAHYCSTFFN